MRDLLSPGFRAFLCACLLFAVLFVAPAYAESPNVLRILVIDPCEQPTDLPPLYVFVLTNGSVAVFQLDRVNADAEVRAIFLQLLRNAEANEKGKPYLLREKCPEKGVAT